MSDRLQELIVFVRAVETGSFSAAARNLGLSHPSVSRMISDLESRVGSKLLLRNTRRIVLTEAGQVFLGRVRCVLDDLEQAGEAARGADSLKGLLRIAMSTVMAVKVVIPCLPAFLEAYPSLKVELLISDEMHDLVAEGADIAIRFGTLENSAFGSRKLATIPRVLIASPAYLCAKGTPLSPAELFSHECIAGPGGSASQYWTFAASGIHGDTVSVKVEPRVQVTSAIAVLACAKIGLGITISALWACDSELKSGTLVTLLDNYKLPPLEVHAVFPAGREPSQKVKLFTTYLSEVIAELPGKK